MATSTRVMTAADLHRQRRRKILMQRSVLIGLEILLAVVILLPFLWMVSVSLKPPTEPFSIPPRLLPHQPTLDNYKNAFQADFRRYFLNSIIVSLATMFLSISIGLLAAYGFGRFKVPGGKALLVGILLAQMFPVATIIIPIYKIMRDLDLINKYPSLIIGYLTLTLPVSIWMLRGFIRGIPPDLEEAAMVDGCTRFQAFRRVILPLSGPGIAATAVWIAVVTWQEFLFALAFTTRRDMRTLSVGILDFIGQFHTDYGELMAGAVMVSLPVVALFFFLQKSFVAGLTAGATKG
jgi:multiple sugar transport system permease protein/raffinose/stachyose/melibiose transport system permease protein